ncbi:LysE family translocator [Rhodovulum sp. DZ06]|uniref:LysE family translocator n=1 Tax=Rhodovulum sp. DZ06 TaxID=3425126 RepID=UPI003D358768
MTALALAGELALVAAAQAVPAASVPAASVPAAPDPLGAETLLALAAFAFAGSWTPGPNNAMLAASGARFGYRATLPHLLGVTIGFCVMCFAIGLGLGEAFQRSAILREGLRWAGAAAMLYIAWKIATAPAPGSGRARGRPLSFLEAAGFQWINPKAWMMCLGVLAQFASGAAPVQEAAAAAAVFFVSGLSSTHAWTLFGKAAGRWLGDGWRLRAFNLGMAGLVAMGVVALMTEDFG